MMTGVFRLMVVLGLLAAANGWAVPKVGKLDGAAGPRLPAVATPVMGMVAEETLTDSQLAEFMEEIGDCRGAATAWLGLAHDSFGTARTRPLMRAAAALERCGDGAGAARIWRFSGAPEALYRLSVALPEAELSDIQAKIEALPDDPWKDAALYRLAWREAFDHGAVNATFDQPQATLLRGQVDKLQAMLAGRAGTAGYLGLVPGLGHGYLGQPRVAAAVLPLWALLVWLVLWHWKRRQWPYVLVWALPLLAVWWGSPLLALKEGQAQAKQLRQETMLTWGNMLPWDADKGTPPKEQQALVPVVPTGTVSGSGVVSGGLVSGSVVSGTGVTPTVAVKTGDVFVMKRSDAKLAGR